MAGALRIKVSDPSDAWVKAMKGKYKPIAKAATMAMRQVANNIKVEGRANIVSAGFSRAWANSFRADAYPKAGKVSADAAAMVRHKIDYADIFETGGIIHGDPTLWLPLPTTPKRIGRKRVTPSLYISQIGPLFPIRRPGKPPLLAARMGVSARAKKSGSFGKVTNAKLRKGASGSGPKVAVPLFVGIRQVDIKQKFHLRAITKANAAKLAAYYYRNFLDE
jgi:hypothetical protein